MTDETKAENPGVPLAPCPHENAVFWNPFNRVVQCHRCGTVFEPRDLFGTGPGGGPSGGGGSFESDLGELLNRHSREKGSDTPDFILRWFLVDCLDAFDAATRSRTEWYGPRIQK